MYILKCSTKYSLFLRTDRYRTSVHSLNYITLNNVKRVLFTTPLLYYNSKIDDKYIYYYSQ